MFADQLERTSHLAIEFKIEFTIECLRSRELVLLDFVLYCPSHKPRFGLNFVFYRPKNNFKSDYNWEPATKKKGKLIFMKIFQ